MGNSLGISDNENMSGANTFSNQDFNVKIQYTKNWDRSGNKSDLSLVFEDPKKYNNPANVNFSDYTVLPINELSTDVGTELGLTLKYPSNWTIEKNLTQGSIILRSMPENSSDKAQGYAKLEVRKINADTNIDEQITARGENSTILEKSLITFQGTHDARKIIFTFEDLKYGNIKVMKVATIKEGILFVISYFAQENRFDQYLPTIHKMIDSLSIFDLKKYENFDSGISITYPSNWTATEQKPYSAPDYLEVMKTMFSIPQKSNSSNFINGVEILRYNNNTSLGMFADHQIELRNNSYWKYRNFRIVEPVQPISIDTLVLNYQYNDPVSGDEIKETQILTKQDEMIYSISFIAEKSKYLLYLPIVLKVFNSFEVLKLLPYENFDVAMRFNYPSNWNFTTIDSDNMAIDYGRSVLFTPKEESNSLYNEREGIGLRIFSSDIGKEMSLMDAANQRISEYKQRQTDFKEFTLFNQPFSKTIIPGYNSIVLNGSYLDSHQNNITVTDIMTKNLGKVYHVLYSAEDKKYSKYLPGINEITKSIQMFALKRLENKIDNNAGITLEYPSDRGIPKIEYLNPIRSYSNLTSSRLPYVMKQNVFPFNGSIGDLRTAVETSINKNNLTYNNTSVLYVHTTMGEYQPGYKTVFSFRNEKGHNNTAVLFYTEMKHYAYLTLFISDSFDYYQHSTSIDNILNSIRLMSFVSLPEQDQLSNFDNKSYDFRIMIPNDWTINFYESTNIITVNKSDINFQIASNVVPGVRLSDIVSSNLNFIIPDKLDFNIIRSGERVENNDTVHEIEYTYYDPPYEKKYHTLEKYILHNKEKLYTLTYTAPFNESLNEYYNYFPTIEVIMKSFRPDYSVRANASTGFAVGKSPSGIAFNPNTDEVYIADGTSNTVSVLDGKSYDTKKTLKVGKTPQFVSVDPSLNVIYVGNLDSKSISIIDGSGIDPPKEIFLGTSPLAIAINTLTHKVYVADADYNVSIIDGPTAQKVENLSTGGLKRDLGIGIAVNEFTNHVYVANPATNNVTVIDGRTNEILSNISLARFGYIEPRPFDIAINPFTNKAYVLNSAWGNLSVIDLGTNGIVGEDIALGVGSFYTVSINRITNMLYVTDSFANRILVVDASTGKYTESIAVDPSPFFVAINEDLDKVYVPSTLSAKLSILNGKTKNIIYGTLVRIDTEPLNFGIFGSINVSKSVVLYCNGEEIINNTKIFYDVGKQVECYPVSKNNFLPIVHTTWKGPDSDPPIKFNVTKHGELSGKFIDLGDLLIVVSPYLGIGILGIVLLLALIPSILTRVRQEAGFLYVDKRTEELLSRTELIGINASVIVGVLIFFTLSEGFASSEQSQISMITAYIIIPFTISVITALNNYEKLSMRLMIAGFLNLIISTVLIVIMKVLT